MIVLGVLLILLALGAGAATYLAAFPLGQRTEVDAFGVTIGLTPFQLVVLGAAIVLVLWWGWAILRRGIRHSARRRRERKATLQDAEQRRVETERTAEEKLREQRLATEAARRRADAAEARAHSTGEPGGRPGTGDPDPGDRMSDRTDPDA